MSTKKQQHITQNHSTTSQQHPSMYQPSNIPIPDTNPNVKVWYASQKYQELEMPILEHVSELYKVRYEPVMGKIQTITLEQATNILKQNGFLFIPSTSTTAQPLKILRKAHPSFLLYSLKLGPFESQLTLFPFPTKSTLYTPQSVAKGQFGKISLFQHESRKYALKSVKVDQGKGQGKGKGQEFFNAMMEIFMIKLGSALGVGPKFWGLGGFDGVLFQDCLQFVMEYCEINSYPQEYIEQQLKQKNLLKNLKLLHTLNLCHCDIKPDNIGWSPTHKKFIFLDFGFSKFLAEPPGSKTLCSFKGTFRYCSEQMKKLYLLKNKSYVDLYYNDLCCLEKSLLELEKAVEVEERFYDPIFQVRDDESCGGDQGEEGNQLSKPLFMEEKSKVKAKKKESRLQNNYSHMLSFYKLKYHLFLEEYKTIFQLVLGQKTLIYTFRRMLFQATQTPTSFKHPQKIQKIYEKHVENCLQYERRTNCIEKFDAILCDFLVRTACERVGKGDREELRERVQGDGCGIYVKECWGQPAWMEEIFFYLDDESDLRQRAIPKHKHNLIRFLYKHIKSLPNEPQSLALKPLTLPSPPSLASQLHTILLAFFQYFHNLHKIQILELILPYFIVFQDCYNLLRMEECVLAYKGLGDTGLVELVRVNLGFFVGRRLGELDYVQGLDGSKNISNVQAILSTLEAQAQAQTQHNSQTNSQTNSQLSSSPNLLPQLEFVSQTLSIMHSLSTLQKCKADLYTENVLKNQLLSYIRRYLQKQQDLSLALQILAEIRCNRRKKLKIDRLLGWVRGMQGRTRFFQTCFVQILHVVEIELNQDYRVKKYFFSYFFPFDLTDLSDLTLENKSLTGSLKQKQNTLQQVYNEKLQHFFQIRLHRFFKLTQLEIATIMNFLPQISKISAFFHNFVDGFQLASITNFEDLLFFIGSFSRILYGLMPISEDNPAECQEIKYFVASKALELLEWVGYFIKEVQVKIRNQERIARVEIDILGYCKNLEGLAKLAIGQLDEAAEIFMYVQQNNKGPNGSFFYLCEMHYFFEGISPQMMKRIGQLIANSDFLNQEIPGWKDRVLSCSIMYRAIVDAKLKYNKFDESYCDLIQILVLLDPANSNYLIDQVMPMLVQYLMQCNPAQLLFIYTDFLRIFKLSEVCKCPALGILIFQLLVYSGEVVKSKLSYEAVRKGYIYCAFALQAIDSYAIASGKIILEAQVRKFLKVQRHSVAKFKRMLFGDRKRAGGEIKKYLSKVKTNAKGGVYPRLQKALFRICKCNLQDEQIHMY